MSEPELLDNAGCHPCRYHDTYPLVRYFDWRSPAYWIECPYADMAVQRDSLEQAVDVWNELMPDREIPDREALLAAMVAALKPIMTDEFLKALEQVANAYGNVGEIADFVDWCHGVAEKKQS